MSIVNYDLGKDDLANDGVILVVDTFRSCEQNVKSRLSVPCRYLTLDSHIKIEE